MSKVSKALVAWLLLFLQILWANSLHIEKGWNLISNFDTEQNVGCLLKKLDKPSFVWAYDNLKKRWRAQSNDDKSNLKIINSGVNIFGTINPYQSFWIYNGNQTDIDFDCNTSLHVDINRTKKLANGWNLISNVDVNQSTFLLLNELNSTGLIFVYDNVDKNWFAKTNDLNTSQILYENSIAQIDTLLPYKSFWIYNDHNATNLDFNVSEQFTQMFYENGDLKDYNLTDLHTSFKETVGVLVQAILSVNSVLYTDTNETNITEFQDRKDQAIEALDALIELSSQTEDFADKLPDSDTVGRLLKVTSTPQEIYAIINDSKIKGHIKTLMQHFNVGAHQAKKILDDAMSSLESKYSKDADFYTKAIVVSQAIRDTSALTVTIGSSVLTAGAATTVIGTALEAGETIIAGSDALIKASKSMVELYMGKDGALDGAIKNSMILRGISDVNEIISIKGLFNNPSEKAKKIFTSIGRYSWVTDKAKDMFYDKKISIGEEEISFAQIGANELNSTKQELDSIPVPNTFIGNFEVNTSKIYTSFDSDILETNVTKVLDLNNTKIEKGNTIKIVTQAMPKIIEKILTEVPKDKRIKATKEIVEKSWDGWPEPQWCPKVNYDKAGYIITIWLDDDKGIATCNYDEYGDLKEEYLKVNNSMDGVKKYYYQFSGNLKEEMPYTDGLLNGNCMEYYENGTIREIFPYVLGKREGIYKYFYETGILHREVIYKQDIKTVEKWYNDSGCLTTKNIYDSEHYEPIDTIYYDCSE